jgi:hypothetical protein
LHRRAAAICCSRIARDQAPPPLAQLQELSVKIGRLPLESVGSEK